MCVFVCMIFRVLNFANMLGLLRNKHVSPKKDAKRIIDLERDIQDIGYIVVCAQ